MIYNLSHFLLHTRIFSRLVEFRLIAYFPDSYYYVKMRPDGCNSVITEPDPVISPGPFFAPNNRTLFLLTRFSSSESFMTRNGKKGTALSARLPMYTRHQKQVYATVEKKLSPL